MERSLSEAHKKTPQKIAMDRAADVAFIGLVFQIQQNTDDGFDIKIAESVSEATNNKKPKNTVDRASGAFGG